MADSLTREQRAMLEGFGRSAAEMLCKRPQPSLKVARGYIAEAGERTYDVLMQDGAVLEDVPCLVSALGGKAGDEARVEFVQGRALVTGIVATADNAGSVVLYEDWSTPMSQAITLSQDVTGFSHLLVWGVSNDQAQWFTDVWGPKVGMLFTALSGAYNGQAIVKLKMFCIGSERRINTAAYWDVHGGSVETPYQTYEWNSGGTGVQYSDYMNICVVIGIR